MFYQQAKKLRVKATLLGVFYVEDKGGGGLSLKPHSDPISNLNQSWPHKTIVFYMKDEIFAEQIEVLFCVHRNNSFLLLSGIKGLY